jgi:CRISPR-associated protein Cas2
MSDNVRRVLVAYDVSDDARRDRVAVALQAHGDRVQYSVFLVDAKDADLVRLDAALRALIEPLTDSVMFCDLGPVQTARSRVRYIGRERGLTGDRPALIL